MSDWEPTETVYEHASGNDTFTVTACERWSKNQIARLKAKYPDEVDIRHVNKDGSIVAHIPLDWMRIVPKRKDTRSAETKARVMENMRHGKTLTKQRENGAISED